MYLATQSSAFLPARIEGIKTYIYQKYGIALEQVICREQSTLPDQTYVIKINGLSRAKGKIGADRFLLASPKLTSPDGSLMSNEPVFGLAGRWANETDPSYEQEGLSSDEVIATHLLETLERHLDQFATFERVSSLWQNIKTLHGQSSWHDQLEQKIKLEDLLELSQYLLQENIGLRNFAHIIELLFRFKKDGRTEMEVYESIRRELSGQVLERISEVNEVLDAATLEIGRDAQALMQNGGMISPDLLSKIVKHFQKWSQDQAMVPSLLLVERAMRRQVFEILHSMQIRMNVLAYDEVPYSQKLNVIEKIEI